MFKKAVHLSVVSQFEINKVPYIDLFHLKLFSSFIINKVRHNFIVTLVLDSF